MQPSVAKVATESERGEAASTKVFRVRTPEATRKKVLAYSSAEEYYATNVETEVRIFLSQPRMTRSSTVEHYSDTVKVDSSSLSVTTDWLVAQW